jgi:NAD(P)-dependent dehydrogenase (short-subunit alcohol dehydrogenase family)
MAERAALITGGSSGIGFAIARLLGAELGYALTVNGRRPDKLEAAVQWPRRRTYSRLSPSIAMRTDAWMS